MNQLYKARISYSDRPRIDVLVLEPRFSQTAQTMSNKRKAGEMSDSPLSESSRKIPAIDRRRRPVRKKLDNEDIERLSGLRISPVSLPLTKQGRKIGNTGYKFDFPFSELPGFHYSAWGVRFSADSVRISLRFWLNNGEQRASLCVHYAPPVKESEYRHKDIRARALEYSVCHGEPNFFTAALIPRLSDLIEGDWDKEKCLEAVRDIASIDPTTTCIICGKGLFCKVYRPMPCSSGCRQRFAAIPLATRLSPFLQDPPALDLLLCCLASSTYDQTESPKSSAYGKLRPNPSFETNLPPTFPVAKEKLHNVLDSFPPISSNVTLSKLLGTGEYRAERRALLCWLSREFDGTLVSAPAAAIVPGLPGKSRQFLLLNTNLNRQAAFEERLCATKIESGTPAFHGTATDNVFKIPQEGLRESGSLETVYYSNEASTSLKYAIRRSDTRRQALTSCKNSACKDQMVLFGVEVALKSIRFTGYGEHYEHNSAQERVMIRHLFLFPPVIDSTSYVEQRFCYYGTSVESEGEGLFRSKMRQIYAQIKSGEIVKQIEKDSARKTL